MEINNINIVKGFEPISSAQMYSIENNAASNFHMEKVLMMENAGNRISDYLIEKFRNDLFGKNIVAICGMGNNGGDALVAMRHLSGFINSCGEDSTTKLSVVLLGHPDKLRTTEAKVNWKIVESMNSIEKITLESKELTEVKTKIKESHIIIDGLLGTGIKDKLRDPYSSVIDLINDDRNSNSFVVSVDLPSGMDPDTGKIDDKVVKAAATITFHRIKHGLLGNHQYCGNVIVNKIGIPWEAELGVL